MNVLTFRNRSALKVKGDVKINGNLVKDALELASISGYVQQDDLFIGTLKVKEHLKFQVSPRPLEFVTKLTGNHGNHGCVQGYAPIAQELYN